MLRFVATLEREGLLGGWDAAFVVAALIGYVALDVICRSSESEGLSEGYVASPPSELEMKHHVDGLRSGTRWGELAHQLNAFEQIVSH